MRYRRLFGVVTLALTAVLGIAWTQHPGASFPPPSPDPAIRVSGAGSALPVVGKLADAYARARPTARFEFEAGTNSGGAVSGVVAGALDIAATSRPLTDSESREAIEYRNFARDAVAFAAREPAPVIDLSAEQVRAIYAGELTDWQRVGGPAGTIFVLDRDEDDAARKLGLVPLMAGREVTSRATVLTSAGAMLKAIQNTPNSIGYTSLGIVTIQRPDGIRIVNVDGVRPGPSSVEDGTYPYHIVLGLVRRQAAPETVRGFVDFTLSSTGRQILQDLGYATP